MCTASYLLAEVVVGHLGARTALEARLAVGEGLALKDLRKKEQATEIGGGRQTGRGRQVRGEGSQEAGRERGDSI